MIGTRTFERRAGSVSDRSLRCAKRKLRSLTLPARLLSVATLGRRRAALMGAAQERQPKEPFAALRVATDPPLDVKGARAVVLVFTTTDCPIANYYTAEINAIVKDYANEPVRFVVVHVDP